MKKLQHGLGQYAHVQMDSACLHHIKGGTGDTTDSGDNNIGTTDIILPHNDPDPDGHGG